MRGLGGGVASAALVTVAAGWALASPAEDARSLDPRGLLARTFENLYGFSSIQQVEIRARTPDGREFRRTAQVTRRGAREGLNRMLVRFLSPGDIRGIGVLLLERDDFSYDAFVYQPALGRVRRISVAQRRDPFFGTDIFFEDLEARRVDQWQTRVLRDEPVAGRRARVLELVPQGLPSGYERIVAWFDLELPVILRAEYYRGDRRLKTLEVDPARVRAIDGYWIPLRMRFSRGAESETLIEVSDVEVRPELPDEMFTRSMLQFGDEQVDKRHR